MSGSWCLNSSKYIALAQAGSSRKLASRILGDQHRAQVGIARVLPLQGRGDTGDRRRVADRDRARADPLVAGVDRDVRPGRRLAVPPRGDPPDRPDERVRTVRHDPDDGPMRGWGCLGLRLDLYLHRRLQLGDVLGCQVHIGERSPSRRATSAARRLPEGVGAVAYRYALLRCPVRPGGRRRPERLRRSGWVAVRRRRRSDRACRQLPDLGRGRGRRARRVHGRLAPGPHAALRGRRRHLAGPLRGRDMGRGVPPGPGGRRSGRSQGLQWRGRLLRVHHARP